MERDKVIDILRSHAPELRALGVEHLSVFGSIARGTTIGSSDVDVAIHLAPGPRGFERLGRIDAVEQRLVELLDRPVDVIVEPARSPALQSAIERDRVPAF